MKPKSLLSSLFQTLLVLLCMMGVKVEATVPGPPSWGSNYQQVWSQDFTTMSSLSVSANGPCGTGGTTWMATKPGGGNWFDFIAPAGNLDPFGIGSGYLDIRTQNNGSSGNGFSGYTGGILSSVDNNGNGFSQQYGYFECSMWCPGSPNTWPAFWLLNTSCLTNPSLPYTAEIDITESYGNFGTGPNQSPAGNPNEDGLTWHQWGQNGNPTTSNGTFVAETGMTTGYHTYGVDIEPTTTTWYFDRVAIWSAPTLAQAKSPMFLMVNLALGGGNYNNAAGNGYNWTLTPSPTDLKVQYIAVYASPNSPNYVPTGSSTAAIGVNFYDSATGGANSPGNQTLASTDLVGAGGSTTGWNNSIDVASTCPTNVVLKDSSNTATTATLSVTPNGTVLDGKPTSFYTPWNGTANTTSTAASLTAEQRMFNGDIGTANNSGYATELALKNIPYTSYDVYVYVLTSVYTSGSAQIFNGGVAGGAGTTYYFAKGVPWAPGDHLPTAYTQATATALPSTYGANYIKFSGLSGAAQTIDVVSSTESGLSGTIGITGIEIVPHGAIGVNFYDSATGGANSPGNQTLASTDLVGAGGSTTGWNNSIDVASTCPTNVVLKDSSNTATTATLSVTPNGTVLDGKPTSFYTPWNGTANTTSTAASLTAEQRMFNGDIGTANNSGYATELALKNIPYTSYDVYVYVLTSVYTSGSAQIFNGGVAGGAGTTYYFAKGVPWAPGDHLPTAYTQATATALPSTYGANYIKFSGLSGAAQTIDVVSSTESGLSGTIGITGIEIVPH